MEGKLGRKRGQYLLKNVLLHQLDNKSMTSKFLQLATIFALATVLSALACSSTQYYADDGSCINCPTNCSSCSNPQFCTACLNGYFLVSSNFNVTCQTCSQIYVGCSTCLSNVACSQCTSGYFISNGACSLCSSKIIFCNNCSTDGNTCNQCSFPFILQNNLCVSATVSSVTGGATANPLSSTSNSPSTTAPSSVTLVTLANGTKVPEAVDANGCNQIQIFYLGKCINKISYCSLYQISGLCQYCLPGYLVTIYGDCTPQNRYLSCENGYWLNSNTDACVKVSPACDWYYPNNGSCLNCSTGYAWINNACVQNVACNSRQFFYSGTCIDVPSQCITFSSIDGACTSCQFGYNLQGGLCAFSQSNVVSGNGCSFPCNTCAKSDPSFCYSCVTYYQLVGATYGSCVSVPS